MMKSLIWLSFLLAIRINTFAEEAIASTLVDALKEMPGRSAFWTETYRFPYDYAFQDPFFSPAIVRIGESEEFRLVQSRLLIRDSDSISYFFTVVVPSDSISLQVIPASEVEVEYPLNLPPRFTPEAVEKKIHGAEDILFEYANLQKRIVGVFYIINNFFWAAVSGALFVSALYWHDPNVRVGGEIFFGISTPLLLWLGGSRIQNNVSARDRMKEIQQSLQTLWN